MTAGMQPDTQHGEQAQARMIARQAGWIVIGLGLVDLVVGLVQAPAGTVNFKIGTLLVGLLMLFGGQRIQAIVRWLALLVAAVMLTGLLTSAAVVPMDLTLAQVRLYPMAFAASCIPWLISVAAALVAALRLSHPQLLAARARIGRPRHSARIPLVLGVLLAIGSGFIQYKALRGDAAQKASRAVAEKLGPGYQYFTNSLNKTIGTPTKYSATVQVWNEREVLSVPVHWQE
jgi:hypothetical protein